MILIEVDVIKISSQIGPQTPELYGYLVKVEWGTAEDVGQVEQLAQSDALRHQRRKAL